MLKLIISPVSKQVHSVEKKAEQTPFLFSEPNKRNYQEPQNLFPSIWKLILLLNPQKEQYLTKSFNSDNEKFSVIATGIKGITFANVEANVLNLDLHSLAKY